MSAKIKELLQRAEKQRIANNMPSLADPAPREKSDVEEFVEAFEAAWIDSRDTSRQIEDDGFHPSSLGIAVANCGRRNVYLLRGVEKSGSIHDSRIMRVFANGHAVHERLQDLLGKMEVDFDSEVEIRYEEPPVRGHCDGALTWRGRRIVIEIKSCSEEVFVNRKKFRKPKDEHFDQANIYAYILGVDTIWVIYENKNTQEVAFFEKPADPVAAKKIIDRWHAEWLCFQAGETPKRPYKPGSPTCAGCDLKRHCWDDPEVGVDLKPYKEKVKELNEHSNEDEQNDHTDG